MGRRGIYHLPVTLPDIIARFCKLSRAEKDRLELKGRVEFLAEFPFPFETSTFYDIRNNIFFFFSDERAGERDDFRTKGGACGDRKSSNLEFSNRFTRPPLARRVIPMTSLCGKR